MRSKQFCLAFLLLLASGRAHAQVSALDDAAVRARIARVQAILDERAGRAQLWQYGWAGLGYAVTGGFVAIAATTKDKDQRLDFAFAAGGALIDTSVHVLGSIQVHAAARLRDQPDGGPEPLRRKLAFAEAELAAVADAEKDRRSLLKAQLLPVGFSVLTGLVLGIGFGHWRGAAINTAAAIVVNELRVLTQPTSTIDALQAYQRDPSALNHSHGAAWSLAVSATGCTLLATF
jgi:hypothetical protein